MFGSALAPLERTDGVLQFCRLARRLSGSVVHEIRPRAAGRPRGPGDYKRGFHVDDKPCAKQRWGSQTFLASALARSRRPRPGDESRGSAGLAEAIFWFVGFDAFMQRSFSIM